MLKTCKYCGIVPYNHVCPHKRYKKKRTEVDIFRSSTEWTKKSIEIRKRDLYLCQICIRELYDTINKYNSDNLSVHHNIPIVEDYNKRLDNDNLLTVCDRHHEMCESGKISREEVQQIINEQISPL